MEQSGYSRAAAERFPGVLPGWLTGHIMMEDQEITGELVSARIYDMPSDTSVVAQAVNHATEDAFRLTATLVDDHYDSRSMGNALYGRLLYDTGDGSK